MTLHSALDLTLLATEALVEKGFIPDFPPPIPDELKKIHPPEITKSTPEIRDLRKLLWCSIDNDDSRDLDQLTYAEQLPENKYKVYIAVANVDQLVKRFSAIDQRAANNTTSIYTPTKIFPMLPEMLSTDLTSLNPDQDRLAMIFEGVISSIGELEQQAIYLANVHNYAQLAYNGVGSWLEGAAPPAKVETVQGLKAQLLLQDKITQLLAASRHRHGALSVETIEAIPIVADGMPMSIDKVQLNRAHSLIENFMIIANTISACYAEAHQLFSLRRVVIVPKRWDKIMMVAADLGTTLPETPDSVALENFLVKQKKLNPTTFPDLSLTIIKLLGRGEYRISIPGKETPGHFGLALPDYSHSTAPNRRYPDLITQRLLLASLAGQPQPYSKEELDKLAERCTLKEDDAEKIERRMRKSAAALVLSKSIGQEFDGIVTGVNEGGTWVRIFNPPVEGKLVKSKDVDVGDRIRVKLIYTDARAGYIDFAILSKSPKSH